MKRLTFSPLTAEQTAALQAFANAHGRRWKAQLIEVYWYNARIWHATNDDTGNRGHILHGLRNAYGPTWLRYHCTVKPE